MTVDELKYELDKCYGDATVTVRTAENERIVAEAISIYDDEVIIEM